MYGANLAGLLDGPSRWAAERPAVLVGERVERTWAGLAGAVARRAAGERSTFFVPPTLLRRPSTHPRVGEARGKIGTIIAGAAPILPDDLRAAVGALGLVVWNGYGQGESRRRRPADPPLLSAEVEEIRNLIGIVKSPYVRVATERWAIELNR